MRGKINLVRLSKNEIGEIRGGYNLHCDEFHCCGCGCYFASSGGSSTSANDNANYNDDLYSPNQ